MKMDLSTVFVCLILICTLVRTLSSSRMRKKLPPGPLPFPIIGNLLALGHKPHKSLAELSKIHGPIMTLKLGQVTTVVISSATMAREVLQKHDVTFSNRSIPDSVRALNHHEFVLSWLPVSPTWKNHRRIFNTHLFSVQKLNASQHVRRHKLQELISDIQESCLNGARVNIGEEALKTSLNFLSSTIFSVNLADQSSEFSKDFKELTRKIMEEAGKPNLADYFPILRMLDPQGMTVYFKKMFELFDSLVDQRLKLRNCSSNGGPNRDTSDALDTLIDIMEDDNEDTGRNRLLHLLMVLFIAGTDTTASTIEWGMAELLHNPEVLSKAKAELDQKIGKGKPIQELDMAKLPYLQAVIKETLRLHPPAPLLLPHKAMQDVDISGFTVPKGAQVLVNAWAIGRDTNTWENPNAFSPQRFLVMENEIDFKGRDFELIPFGSGRRICPGLAFADRMVHLVVGSLVNMFNWKLEDEIMEVDLDMDDKFGLTLQMAKPLRAVPMPL